MKKLFSLAMSILLLITCFAGCRVEEPESSVTVTIMLENENKGLEVYLERKVTELYGEDIKVEYVRLTSDYAIGHDERNMELTRVRTEIMAGDGPDIYLLPTKAGLYEGLFSDVSEAMRNGLFLPLDDYIAESEYIKPENYIEVLYDTGKTNEGQMVIPMLYYQPYANVYKRLMKDPDTELSTIEEIIVSDDDALIFEGYQMTINNYLACFLPPIADYDTGNLTVTKEELKKMFADMYPLVERYSQIENKDIYFEVENTLFGDYSQTMIMYNRSKPGEVYDMFITNGDEIPTARISAFAAIDRNTEHPDETFKIFELICGYPTLQNTALRYECNDIGAMKGLPTVKAAYSEQDLIEPEFIEEFDSRINTAVFETELDDVICRHWNSYAYKKSVGEAVDLEAVIDDLYRELQMCLAE